MKILKYILIIFFLIYSIQLVFLNLKFNQPFKNKNLPKDVLIIANDLLWFSYLKNCEFHVYNNKNIYFINGTEKNPLSNFNIYYGELDFYIEHYTKYYLTEIPKIKKTILKDKEVDEIYFISDSVWYVYLSGYCKSKFKSVRKIYNSKGDTFHYRGSGAEYRASNLEIVFYPTFGINNIYCPSPFENICNIDCGLNQSDSIFTNCGKKEFIESHRYILNEWFVKEAERRKYISADSTAEWKQCLYRKYYQVTRRGIQWIPDEWLFKWNDFKKCIMHDWEHFWYDPNGILFENGFFYCHTCEYFKSGTGAN